MAETGLAADLAALACAVAGAESHPPAGVATLTASSGWGSGVKVWIASLAAASDWGSSRQGEDSRIMPNSIRQESAETSAKWRGRKSRFARFGIIRESAC